MSDRVNTSSVSFVLPVYNEAENVVPMILRLRAAVPGCEIIIVDDNSPDGSAAAAESAGARVICRKDERGLPGAIRAGLLQAKGAIICWMDCDLSMPPEDARRLVDAVRNGADIAVGSRYAPGGKDRRPLFRTITSLLINRFACAMLPVKVRDYDSGFVAARRSVIESVPFSTDGYGEYCIEFLCMAGMKGNRIDEIGYVFSDRIAGTSKSAPAWIPFIRNGANYVRKVLQLRRACLKMSIVDSNDS